MCSLLVLFHLVVVTDCQAGSPPDPQCFDTTTCPCCKPGTCPSDGSGQCGGNCLDGFHSGKCGNRCPDNCVRCTDAPQGGGVSTCTQCKDGYYSTPTQYQCQLSCQVYCIACASSTHCISCMDGHYMTESNQCAKCNDSCASCNSAAFCTACKDGYFQGQNKGTCSKCSPLCVTCSSYDSCTCSNGCMNSCDQSTGTCRFGCRDRFELGPLQRCDICVNGMYGIQCNTLCSDNCESTCERISGVCDACKTGFYGDYCDASCPENCASTCNRSTGYCFSCKEGYYGNMCTYECQTNCKECTITSGTCTACVDGYYGNSCDNNCSENCLINKCDKNDGSCECFPGYEGDTCQQKVTTSTTPRFLRDRLPLVVTSTPENYVGETIGLTLAGVVVIAGVIGGAILLYRRRTRNTGITVCPCISESLPVMSFKARTSNEAKLKAELESLREKIATFDAKAATARERYAEVEAQIQELDRQMPYRHTDRADVITEDNSYEMLQRQKQEEQGHYTSIKY